MPTTGWWEVLWSDPAAVLAAVDLKPDMDAVDLCSGNGWFTLPMARTARRVLAVDIDAAMLDAARAYLEQHAVANVMYREADAHALPEFVQDADFIFMANAFHGVPDRPRLARAVRDALKPGGRFAIVNWHPRPREETPVLGEPRGPKTELRLSAEETTAAVMAGGLIHVATVELPPYHYGVIFSR
jgi:ubiquinone/menaquinone biosynthesis C-methylase UbiE